MKKYRMQITVVMLLVAAGMAVALSGGKQKPEVAFINNQMIYDEFQLTKDLLVDYNKMFAGRKSILDSMEVKIAGLTKKVEVEKQQNKEDIGTLVMWQEEFLMRKKQMEEDNQMVNQKFQSQILNQLNQYIKEFGKEKSLKLLLGANGNGDIMYADSTVDYTKEAIVFVNKKYKGVH